MLSVLHCPHIYYISICKDFYLGFYLVSYPMLGILLGTTLPGFRSSKPPWLRLSEKDLGI